MKKHNVMWSTKHKKTIYLYFSNDNNKYEIFDVFIYYFLYPGSIYLFVTGLVSCHFLRIHWFLYVFCASLTTIGLEFFAHYMHVFTYIHWSIWFSLIVYIPLYSINVGLYYFVSNHVNRLRMQKSIN